MACQVKDAFLFHYSYILTTTCNGTFFRREVEERERFELHLPVLCARCPALYAQLRAALDAAATAAGAAGGATSAARAAAAESPPRVVVDGVAPATFRTIVGYIYGGDCSLLLGASAGGGGGASASTSAGGGTSDGTGASTERPSSRGGYSRWCRADARDPNATREMLYGTRHDTSP